MKKCSFTENKEISVVLFYQDCKIYICNKCEKIHSGWFKNHFILNLDKDIKEIFTGFCNEENNSYELDFFSKYIISYVMPIA